MSDNNKNQICTLLMDPNEYNPDTLDLNSDLEAREYWLECFANMIKKFSNQAAHSERNDPSAAARAQQYQKDCMDVICAFKSDTQRRDPLTIRNLLQISDSCLRLNGFTDPWLEEKRLENSASLSKFRDRLEELDKLGNPNEKWLGLLNGVFAGNIFDWGAMVVSQILENDKSFGLHDALKRIQKRPWLIDGLDSWLERLQGPPHKCAVIFVDNSGVDIVLGIIPFARELLRRGTKVILSANDRPSLNDITTTELHDIIERCCDKCPLIKNAYDKKQLEIFSNGQSGPCLDMRFISSELCNAIQKNETDLLIIEGMARALHTNLNAQFKFETLKLAVVKNKWWANRLGGDTFSIICKYEPSQNL